MTKMRPAYSRHTNHQIVEGWIETDVGRILGYVFVVPNCLRRHDSK